MDVKTLSHEELIEETEKRSYLWSEENDSKEPLLEARAELMRRLPPTSMGDNVVKKVLLGSMKVSLVIESDDSYFFHTEFEDENGYEVGPAESIPVAMFDFALNIEPKAAELIRGIGEDEK